MGIMRSQLTFIFFRGIGIPPTSERMMDWIDYLYYELMVYYEVYKYHIVLDIHPTVNTSCHSVSITFTCEGFSWPKQNRRAAVQGFAALHGSGAPNRGRWPWTLQLC